MFSWSLMIIAIELIISLKVKFYKDQKTELQNTLSIVTLRKKSAIAKCKFKITDHTCKGTFSVCRKVPVVWSKIYFLMGISQAQMEAQWEVLIWLLLHSQLWKIASILNLDGMLHSKIYQLETSFFLVQHLWQV